MQELKELSDLGFSLLPLKPKSKMPIEKNWTSKPRLSWREFQSKLPRSGNVGVRLGSTSFVDLGFLAVIDCDVKSKDPKHKKELEEKLKELHLTGREPTCLSGRGNGSKHIYFLSEEPLKPFRFSQSKDFVKVYMPGGKPSRREMEVLTPNEIAQGLRLRAAWEISIMGEGQQVVLPPSKHPDTGGMYKWVTHFNADNLDFLDIKTPEKADTHLDRNYRGFKEIDVNVRKLKLSDTMKNLIIDGVGSTDRSKEVYLAAQDMIKIGLNHDEILSVLTNKEYYLGACAYDHRKTKNRQYAGEWVYKYTLAKADKIIEDTVKNFDIDDFDNETLSEDATKRQVDDLILSGDWQDRIERTGDPKSPPKSTIKNIELILENVLMANDYISMDAFKLEDKWTIDTPWGALAGSLVSDVDCIKIKMWLSKHYRLEPSTDKIEEVLRLVAARNSFHPVRAYLESLRWDGKPRLNTWLAHYLGAQGPSEYVNAVGRKTLIAMVARIFDPGCKFDQVLILEGRQDIGKSFSARILASDEWFSDADINIGDKDTILNMQGVWVFEIGELSALSRYDVNRMKEFISRKTDRMRPPFGKRTIQYPRQCIFIGTTNNSEYLKDETGNRRYWPVKVGDAINLDRLTQDRDQLLAEAVEHYLIGEELYLETEYLRSLARVQQGTRLEMDELQNVVAEFLTSNPEGFHVNEFRLIDLIKHCSDLAGLKNDRVTQLRIGKCLRNLGFEKIDKRVVGESGQKYMAKVWQKRV